MKELPDHILYALNRAAILNCAKAPTYKHPKCDQIGKTNDRCASCAAQHSLRKLGIKIRWKEHK